MVLAITSGGFDLSVDAVVALTSVFLSILIPDIGIPLAIIISILISCFVGFLNGVIITKFGVNPLITTLSMATIIRGVHSNSQWKADTDKCSPNLPLLAQESFWVYPFLYG